RDLDSVPVRDDDPGVCERLAVRTLDDSREPVPLRWRGDRSRADLLARADTHRLRDQVQLVDGEPVGPRPELGADLERAALRRSGDLVVELRLGVVGRDAVALLEALDRACEGPETDVQRDALGLRRAALRRHDRRAGHRLPAAD